MQELIKQGGRSSGSGQEQTGGSSKGGKLPPQKTASFKGARKWFQRQISGKVSSRRDDEHAAAVAAATYAINILGPSPDPSTRTSPGLETPLPPLDERRANIEEEEEEDGSLGRRAESGRRASKSFTERFLRMKSEDEFDPAIGSTSNPPPEEKPTDPIQSKEKTTSSSFRDKLLLEEEEEEIMKRREIVDAPKPITLPPPPPPPPPPPRGQTRRFPAGFTRKDKGKQKMTDGGEEAESSGKIQQKTEAEADDWERAELAKIKKQYDKLNNTIVKWEDNRMKKAAGRLHKIESEMEKKIVKAHASYRKDMERIRQVAKDEKTQARDKQRNEESKVEEKANKFRATGRKPPAKRCLCL